MVDLPAARGRIDKRRAILEAAFSVFSCQGYDQSSVQDIADEAGVSKQTVYNHFEDKQRVFDEAMAATAESVLADNLAAIERLRTPVADLRASLHEVTREILEVNCEHRSRALRWLTYAQVARFPHLIEVVQNRTSDRLGPALADRLARLVLSGQLRPCDPDQAAEQLLAMLSAPAEARSRMGTRDVPAADIRFVAEGAVDTFLRAYAPPADPGSVGA
ncbi:MULTISPECIES: TetR/AcrR family transcriptional regulator [unclassified Nocardia]|uniref:TetR/AcrR family transcriptional regulator n=1 Tax=unclassified Nocardia TaxID=2637762 RepID=UPI00365F7B2D